MRCATAAALMVLPPGQARSGRKPHTLPGGYKHLVVIYEENHSFDNLYGGWGSVNGEPVEGPGHATNATQVDQYGVALRMSPTEDVNLTSPPLSTTCTDPAHGIATAISATSRSESRTTSLPGQDLSGARRHGAQRRAEGLPGCASGWLHAGPRAPLLPGAVPARRRPAGPLHVRVRRRRPHDGLLRHPQLPDLPVPALTRSAAVRDRRPLLPGSLRGLVPEPPVADRRQVTARHQQWRQRSGELHPGHQRDGQHLSAVHADRDGPRRAVDPGCADPAVDNDALACGDFAVNTIQPENARTPPARSAFQLSTTRPTPPSGTGSPRQASPGTGTPAVGTRPWRGTLARFSSSTTSRSTTSPPMHRVSPDGPPAGRDRLPRRRRGRRPADRQLRQAIRNRE